MIKSEHGEVNRIIEITKKEYSLSDISNVSQNQNAWGGRIVINFQSDGVDYLLKEYPWFSRKEEDIQLKLKAQDVARSFGLPVPILMQTTKGNRSFSSDEHIFYLQKKIGEGYKPGNYEQKIEAVKLLGTLHKAFEHFPLEMMHEQCFLEAELNKFKTYVDSTASHMISIASTDGEKAQLSSIFKSIEDAFDRISKLFLGESSNLFSKSILHGDYQHFNLRFSNNRIVAIVDWDAVRYGYRIFELACAIVFLFGINWDLEYSRDSVWRNPSLMDSDYIDDMVSLYEGEGPKLTKIEKLMIPLACALVAGPVLAGCYRQPAPSSPDIQQPNDIEGCTNIRKWIESIAGNKSGAAENRKTAA